MRRQIRGDTRWLAVASLAMALIAAPAVDACAADPTRAELAARYSERHAAIYDVTVCEYGGLITPEVADGFRRQRDDLVARDALSEETVRDIRIIAWTRADLEWSNRGLGGFRNWCRTEGAAAARRFVAYGQAAPRDAA